MPVNGLPLAVESALESLLKVNKLSTWKITGGENHVAVTLRFNMADIGVAGMDNTVTYKKIPPSQARRNMQRREKWFRDRNNVKSDELPNSSVIENITKDNGSIEVENRSESISADKYVTAEGTQTQLLQITDQAVQASDLDDPHMDVNSAQSTPPEESDSDSSQDTLPEGPSGGTCDICSKTFSSSKSIWTCTQCDNFAMCLSCKSSDFKCSSHTCESDQLHLYYIPGFIHSDCNCDSCGKYFQFSRTKLFECLQCDSFILCADCQREDMHKHHHLQLKQKTKRQYQRT